jgi:non-specific serine/threonine protein kinase
MTRQTKQVKKLTGDMRIAMTGTPIENDLSNLWSLFDFLNKGLLGSSNEFHAYCKSLESHPEGYAKLKAMISPFMLRRVKTDKAIISDLPDKLEQIDYVTLSKKQVVLYRRYVTDLAAKLDGLSGMERRGLVLASLTKLKQICNHPDQYLGQDTFETKDSGKFEMLRDLCGTIYEEIAPYLNQFLREIFHAKGYVLHGGVPICERNRMVEAFQGDAYVPYMILSVRAGGTGLNLTRASHVIHFDRWWNPAVENQATDRAYRIGQKNNVMVHKLVCKGTIEEKIDAMIESKKELAANVIGSGGESWITEMSNEELLSILTLD